MRIIPLLTLLLLPALSLAADPLYLIQNRQPRARILAHTDISPSERTAVKELQSFLAEITAAKLPVAFSNNPQPLPNLPTILVGHKTAQRLANLNLNTLGPDGFIIKRIDNTLILAGGEQRGTLYAVYTFLESLGCRWWTPTESFIPKAQSIHINDLDLRQTPPLEFRDMMFAELWQMPAGQLWRARNKLNAFTSGSIPEALGGQIRFEGSLVHSYDRLLQRNKNLNYPANPSLHALYKGNRNPQNPCLSNSEVLAAIIQSVRDRLRQAPTDAFVVVGQNDGNVYCQCPTCSQLTEKEGAPSAIVLNFANHVADNIAKDFPHARIMSSAYAWSRKPPKNLRPRDNVFIALADIECDFGHPLATSVTDRNTSFVADLQGWARIAKQIYIWDYTTNFDQFLAPFPNLDVLAPNIKFFTDNNVVGYFVQGAHTCRGSEFAPLRMWVLAHAMWDPNADNQALIREFLAGYYGPAADSIQKYIDLLHAPIRNNPQYALRCYGYLEKDSQPYLAPDILAAAESLLRQAESQAQNNPTFQKRLRHAHLPIWYVLARRGPSSASWRAVEKTRGPLSPKTLAANLKLALSENQATKLEESDAGRFANFTQWLDDWPTHAANRPDALPPELQNADPSSYRLFHPINIPHPSKWTRKDPTSTDGWTIAIQSRDWLTQYPLHEHEDFTPGHRYTLFVRVKVPRIDKPGPAFTTGLHHKDGSIEKTIATTQITPNTWQTFEIGSIVPLPTQSFYLATTKDKNVPEVLLDAVWLVTSP